MGEGLWAVAELAQAQAEWAYSCLGLLPLKGLQGAGRHTRLLHGSGAGRLGRCGEPFVPMPTCAPALCSKKIMIRRPGLEDLPPDRKITPTARSTWKNCRTCGTRRPWNWCALAGVAPAAFRRRRSAAAPTLRSRTPTHLQLLLENYALIGVTHEQTNAGRLADALA